MPVDIVMPQLGLTMTEGKVLRWYKSPGERCEASEPLFEVETDKVNMDIEATEAGTLIEAIPPQEQPVPVTTVIGRYAPKGEVVAAAEAVPAAASASAPARHAGEETTSVASASAQAGGSTPAVRDRGPVSPRARATAHRLGVDLAGLQGTSPDGRIVEADVLHAAEARAADPAPVAPRPATAPAAAPAPAPLPGEAIPLSKLRRLTVERMVESFRSAPHFYVSREIDVAELLALKRTLATALEKRGLPELKLTDLLLKAVALAITENPA